MKTPIRCIVSASDSNGEPTLVFVKVICDLDDIDNGLHYKAAKRYVECCGYDDYLAYDENDHGGKLMVGLVDWNTIPTIPVLES